jgi:FdhD protein
VTAEPVVAAPRLAWRDGEVRSGSRDVPEETAIAFTFNREAYAVMMATPADLADFAIGFSLSERIISDATEIEELEVVQAPHGIELRMWIGAELMDRAAARRRRIAGPTGCGLCGLESLENAMRAAPAVRGGGPVAAEALAGAMRMLAPAQALNRATRAVHAAGFWSPARGLVAVREDVGRHSALDKLAGALAQAGVDAAEGCVLMTSRISVELVQKAAAMGAPVLAAVSAPTALAIRVAEAAGMTLVGVARDDGFEVFTHPGRIAMEAADAVVV